MKKNILTAVMAVVSVTALVAQENAVSAKAGYTLIGAKISSDGQDFTSSASGFHVGVEANFELSDKLYAAPELLFTMVFEEDADVKFLQVPLFLKYYASDKFYVSGGPQVTYTLEEIGDDFTKFNIGFGAGLGYEFTERFYGNFRTVYQLNNYYTGDLDIKSRNTIFNLGFGFKF